MAVFGSLAQESVKTAEADGAPLASSSDTLGVVTQKAPKMEGQKGMSVKGLSPRTNYSKVHTAVPPTPDVGAASSGGMAPPPLFAKMGSTSEVKMARDMVPAPSLQEMLDAARSGAYLGGMTSTQLAKTAAEALGYNSDETEEKEDTSEKLSGEMAAKLAAAGRYALQQLQLKLAAAAEEASIQGANSPKQSVSQDGPPVRPEGHAATHPSMPKSEPGNHVPTDEHHRPGGTETQQVPGGAQKSASVGDALAQFVRSKKAAEDGMSGSVAGASGSGGITPQRWEGDQAGPAAKDKGKVPATAEGVQQFTKRDAQATPKQEAAQLLDEPMQSKATDKTLSNAFSHTEEAGAKISHVVRRAAGKALLAKIASQSRRTT